MSEEMTVTPIAGVGVATTYLKATNTRGSRIKVQRTDHRRGIDKTLTVSWCDELNVEENHAMAVREYAQMMNWTHCDWVVGHSTTGFVGLQVPRGSIERTDYRFTENAVSG